MVAKNDLVDAKQAIGFALRKFVGNGARARVRVVETPWGHLQAIVGSDMFCGLSVGERQAKVWEFLRLNVEEPHRVFLYGVNAMDDLEFDDWTQRVSEWVNDQWDGTVIAFEANNDANESKGTA